MSAYNGTASAFWEELGVGREFIRGYRQLRGYGQLRPPSNTAGKFFELSFKSFCNELNSEHLFNFYTALFPTQNIIKNYSFATNLKLRQYIQLCSYRRKLWCPSHMQFVWQKRSEVSYFNIPKCELPLLR